VLTWTVPGPLVVERVIVNVSWPAVSATLAGFGEIE
jgi:hypothetical protein